METTEKNLKKLVLLHSNDMHGDFLAEELDSDLVGGVSMLSGYINKVRSEEQNTLYCIAGDMFRGSVIDSEFKGLSTIEIMNMLAPDVVTIGNHEVDYGVAHLLFLEKCAKFPIINANLRIRTNNTRLFRPYKIVEMDGMRILFIGIITEQVLSMTKSEGLIGTFIDISDAAEEVGRICNAHNSLDIDFTVLLTHIGFEEDKKLAELLDPAWGVDVIIGGHSHTFIDEPAVVNGIPIVQAGTGTDLIGRMDIMIDTDHNCIDSYTWKSIPINPANCPEDGQLKELISGYKDQTDKIYNRVLTTLSHKGLHPSRLQETELGDLFADIFKDSLGLDIMLIGSGSIRTTSMGPIVRLRDLRETYPYDGAVYHFQLTGKEFKEAIRFMLRDEVWAGMHTEFYQLSHGLEIVYSKSAHEFLKFEYEGHELEDDRILSVGMQKFHYLNMHYGLGLNLEKVNQRQKARIVATSEFQVVEEALCENAITRVELGHRLTILD